MKKRVLFIILAATVIILLAVVIVKMTAQDPYTLSPKSQLWNSYAPEFRYYYTQLTDPEKRLFSARYDALAMGDGDLWDYRSGDCDSFERARVNLAISIDCPELMFYGQPYYSYSLVSKPEESYFKANPGKIKDYNELCGQLQKQILEDGVSPYEAELAIDRYIRRNCMYDASANQSASEDMRTAYSSLIFGKANCVGYTMGAMYMLRAANIPCLAVYGYIGLYPKEDSGHMWLMVEIDGQWYHYDPTWDDWDSDDYIEDFYPYFNLSTADLHGLRNYNNIRSQYRFTLPQAVSREANYYVCNGKMLGEDWPTDMYRLVKEAHDSGQNAIGMRFENSQDYSDFINNIEQGNWFPLNMMSFNMQFVNDDQSQFIYLWW
ncbi:MAG: transglutaminase domain-containing protein [Clostridia bacterium]|nr:transglutaminase domain-containing protein [Clostridia bacterium]